MTAKTHDTHGFLSYYNCTPKLAVVQSCLNLSAIFQWKALLNAQWPVAPWIALQVKKNIGSLGSSWEPTVGLEQIYV